MTMTFLEYISLREELQYIVWLSRSTEVASYELYGFRHVLFQLDSFYIELNFLKANPEKIWFHIFWDTERLNQYLKRIDISEIYCC